MNTFYHGDCKFVMEHDIPPESVDLIYLDPPFFTGKVQKGKWEPGAMEVSYQDSKKFWGDTEKVNAMRTKAPEWLKHIAQTRPDFASYLFYMMERLYACKRVLEPMGSIYLHCDWRASHYLKMVMDEIFGVKNFQNEIVWHYRTGAGSSTRYGRKHDIIFFYSKTSSYTFNPNPIRQPYALSTISRLQYKGAREHNIDKVLNRGGRLCDDTWNIEHVQGNAKSKYNPSVKESVGYPTQKPLELLERIIKASSNIGDTILDPFCGCGTAIIVAQQLGRHWIGIDLSYDAYKVSKDRYYQLTFDSTFGQPEPEYIERTLRDKQHPDDPKDVMHIEKATDFEKWVNRFFKARKPYPDAGIDGITPDGTPIQTKTFKIKAKEVRDFLGAIRSHPQIKEPYNHAILISQTDFFDSARQEQSKLQFTEGIKIELLTPQMMLNNNGRGQ